MTKFICFLTKSGRAIEKLFKLEDDRIGGFYTTWNGIVYLFYQFLQLPNYKKRNEGIS